MKLLSFLLFTLLFGSVVPAAAKDAPIRLAPSSKWHAVHENEYCRLSRAFGEGDDLIMIMFDRFAPSQEFRLLLAGKAMRNSNLRLAATVRFGAEAADQKIDFFEGTIGKKIPAWIFKDGVRLIAAPKALTNAEQAKAITEADEAAIGEITIGSPLRRPVVLETGSLKAPFAALRKCTDQLIAVWGLDAERHRNLLAPALPLDNPGDWLVSSDYPVGMIARGQQALVEFRLIVGEDGKAESCTIQQSTNPEGFNKVSCERLLKRAKLAAAIDANGKPVRSYYRNRIRFQL